MLNLILGKAASAFDRAVLVAMQRRTSRTRVASHDERLRRLALIRDAYPADPAGFFPTPPRVEPHVRRVRGLADGREVLDLSWPSTNVPYLESFRATYLAHALNHTAHARLHV